MASNHRRLDSLRGEHSELENHYIDELVAGRLSRRQFMRKGAVIGMSTGLMGAVLAACGSANKTGASAGSSSTATSSSGAGGPVSKGGTLRIACPTPATAMNPLLVDDAGGLALLAQTGDYLVYDNNATLKLEPSLATSWKPSHSGKVWTFTLRSGVKFHDGSTMSADDVVYTFKQLSDKKNASNALSTLGGVLSPDGVRKVDDHTVAFHLDAANGSFPYLVSSDNYNAIIVPKGTDFGKWPKTFIGTGPFKLKSYTQNQGANFVANKAYWGGAPNLDGSAFTFYNSQQPQVLALQGGQVDVITQIIASGSQGLIKNSQYNIIKLKAANHRELSMRCDRAPFTDPRVRQAVALAFDRPGMIKALLVGAGTLGNDSPFAPKYPQTNTSVPQRHQDIAKAKQLLQAAGHEKISVTLATEQYEEIPQLAQIIAQEARAIGVDIKLKVENQSNYYGKATFGNSDWLDSTMSLVDYGDRGVPNVFLESPLTSSGTWNAAHFKNKQYDGLVKQYVAAVDLQSQKQLAGKIEQLLLDQTPIVIPYFNDGLAATTTSVKNLGVNSLAAVFLAKTSKSA